MTKRKFASVCIILISAIFLLFLVLVGCCSFNSTFFPLDNDLTEIDVDNYEEIYLPSVDNKKIYHLFLKPHDKPSITVFMLHGSGSNVSNWVEFALPLIHNGIQVFLMEYRGFPKSQGTSTHNNVLQDAQNAIEYLSKREDVKNTKIILLGQSYGGQPATYLAFSNPGLVDGLVIEGTYTAFSDIAAFNTPFLLRTFTRLIFYNPYKTIENIKKVKTPLLIVHSKEDSWVPFYLAEELYKNANNPKTLWEISGKHIHGLLDFPEEYVRRIKQLIGSKE